MSKLLGRYLIYFGIFICFVQIFEYSTNRWLYVDMKSIGTYAPLFLSALLIDVTYRIGKRQNEIAKQQVEIQKQQYRIEKFNNYRDLHRDIYKCKCILEAILPKIYDYFVAADRDIQNNSVEEYMSTLTDLISDIRNGVSDVMLRGCKQLDVQSILDLLGDAGALLIKAMQIPQLGINKFDWATTLVKSAEFREKLTMEEQKRCINSLAKDQNLKAGMNLFVAQYKEVFEGENNILAQLQRLYDE